MKNIAAGDLGVSDARRFFGELRRRPPAGLPEVTVAPPPWTAMQDPTSGATYYYNAETGEASWTGPRVTVR